MAKMWTGRMDGNTSSIADDFNSSISFDSRMYRQDIKGSIAHARMLSRCGIITTKESELLIAGLKGILSDLESGTLKYDMSCEDIHMFIEQVLTDRLGDVGKKLHTARSRNDQVALDLRMYLLRECDEILGLMREFCTVICNKAEENTETIMPGYTHLQRAQPIVFGHHLMAYAMMLLRDISRVKDCKKRMNVSPIGCCALAGTTYDIDRYYEAKLLGFGDVCENSLDGVSDRDFALEILSALSIIMMHLSRFSEEIILWSSWEFRFIELHDSFTTGSSIMPQKKNSDMAELVRGKCGRVYGSLMSLLTTMKGLPLAYNKDIQEDKEGVFDSVDTVKMCLRVLTPMVDTMTVHSDNMRYAASTGFINATDLADWAVVKGLPFRSAYKLAGQCVAKCISMGTVLEDLPLEEYRKIDNIFDESLFEAINLSECVKRRISKGGTSPESVKHQIRTIRKMLLFENK